MVTFEPTIPTVNANGTMNLTYHTRLQPNDVYCGNITQQNSSDMIQETNFSKLADAFDLCELLVNTPLPIHALLSPLL